MNQTSEAGKPPVKLLKALQDVMGELGMVKKAGYNAFHKYKYALEADVIAEVRPAFIKHNLLLIPSVRDCIVQVIHDNILTQATIDYRLIHTTSGEELQYTIVGQGMDKGDKGIYKALTGANKYALLKPLLLATGDDPENDNGEAPQKARADYRDFPVSKSTGEVKKPDYTMATDSQKKLLATLVAEKEVGLSAGTEIDNLIQAGKLTKLKANFYINELSALPKRGDDSEYPMDGLEER